MWIAIALSLACRRSLSGSPFVLSMGQIHFENTGRLFGRFDFMLGAALVANARDPDRVR
jgi:hypothetical protein